MIAFEFGMAGAPESPGMAFPSERFTIGSAEGAGMRFDARLVQPEHAEVLVDAKGVLWIRDLTRHGLLWVNGAQTPRSSLNIGAVIRVGKLELEVRRPELKLDATAKRPTPFATPPLDATAKRPTPFQGPQAIRPSQISRLVSGRHEPVTNDAPRLTPDELPQLTAENAPVSAVVTQTERTILPEGTVLGGRYRILKKLAAGGMGEVYQAEHIELHKQFAVKVMLPALSSDPEFVNRFKREAISASRIGQQNIIDISDFGKTDEGRFYFVMEFLDGLTIASLLHRQGALSISRMVSIGLQTARALAAAHAQGIVHRDMKPENVMVLQRPGQPDFVKVLDFGVAKVSTGPGQGGQTQLGMVVGTPQYMSPEQAMGVVVDTRTDTYALGLIYYEMLTGSPTFSGDTASILMVKQVTEPAPPFAAELTEAVPAALHDLIFQMLEKDPKNRPQSLDEVLRTLETIEAHLKVGAALPTAKTSGRFPATATPAHLAPVRVTASGVPIAAPRTSSPRLAAVDTVTADEPLPEVQKSKAPLIALAAVVLGLGGGGAYFFTPKPAETLKPAPPPVVLEPPPPQKIEPVPEVKVEAPKLVKLTIQSKPPGAEVFDKDISLGVTPLPLEREPNTVLDLRFVLKGHLDLARKIQFPTTDEARTFELEKKRAGGTQKPIPGDVANPYEQTEDLQNPY